MNGSKRVCVCACLSCSAGCALERVSSKVRHAEELAGVLSQVPCEELLQIRLHRLKHRWRGCYVHRYLCTRKSKLSSKRFRHMLCQGRTDGETGGPADGGGRVWGGGGGGGEGGVGFDLMHTRRCCGEWGGRRQQANGGGGCEIGTERTLKPSHRGSLRLTLGTVSAASLALGTQHFTPSLCPTPNATTRMA